MLHRTTIGGLLSALDKLKKLTPQQRKLFGIVASRRGGIVSRDTAVEELFADREDGGPLTAHKLLNVLYCNLRKRGFPIVTHHGRGLSYRPDWTAKPVKAKVRRRAAA